MAALSLQGWADAASPEVMSAIAERYFNASVQSHRKLGAGSGNAAYLVRLDGHDEPLVFRFSRDFREDVYESEGANYRTLADQTGVRVPEIHVIDRSRSIAPVPLMVMEYMSGTPWKTLCSHAPDHTVRGVRRLVGQFYATLHQLQRPAERDESIAFLALGLAQFQVAVEAGYIGVDLDKVAACEEALRRDAAITSDTLSFCLTDGVILVDRREDQWRVAGVLDLEWAGFANRLADLGAHAGMLANLTALNEPLHLDPAELRRDPLCRAYEAVLPIDYDALARLALYRQLSTWGLVVSEGAPPDKKQWIRDEKGDLINSLIDAVASLGRRQP